MAPIAALLAHPTFWMAVLQSINAATTIGKRLSAGEITEEQALKDWQATRDNWKGAKGLWDAAKAPTDGVA